MPQTSALQARLPAAPIRRSRKRRGIAREPAALMVMRAAVMAATATSVSNYAPALVPSGLAALQQFVTLGAWAAFILASYGVRPVNRLGLGTETVALALFYGFAFWSVLWANLSPSSLMKAVALAITSFACWRACAALPTDDFVDSAITALIGLCLACLAAVVLVPSVGVDQTWMHEGYWQGIFESKQALGSVTAVLIVLAYHRWSTGRGRTVPLMAILALAGTMNFMSGSRDALGLAFLGCAAHLAASRSAAVTRALCFGPAAMVLAAAGLLGFLWTTGEPFIPLFGVKVDLTERVVIWAYALSHFGDRPIAGFGLDGFWSNPEVLTAFNREHGWVLDNYHDGYLAVLMETGIVGMALFAAAALCFGLKAAWLAKPGRMEPSRHRLMVVFATMLFFANFTETYFLRSTNFMAVIGLLAMAMACRTGDAAARPSSPEPTPAPRRAAARPGQRAVAGAALLAALGGAAAPARAADEDPAFATARAMGRGVNLLGYDGLWDGHADSPFRLAQFRDIRAAGFGHVRINVFGFRHMGPDGRLDDTMLTALDTVVEAATTAGLVPVIDEHDGPACQADPAGCGPKLARFWSQVAARFAGRLPGAVFELLNEPGGAMTRDQWNAIAAETLAVVRASNPRRSVVVAALNGLDTGDVTGLALPEADRNVLVTVHYYKPFAFTHQGAPWSPATAGLHGLRWGSPADKAALAADFDAVAAWAATHRRPVYLGEFGVYDAVPVGQRATYAGAVARAATARGWPWAFWQFDHDFALYDTARRRWIRPVLDALMAAGPGER